MFYAYFFNIFLILPLQSSFLCVIINLISAVFEKEVTRMRENLHPNYKKTTISCACGNVIETASTKENIKLATYASRCIENEILMYLRKVSQVKNEISIDEPLNIDWDGNELLLSDILGSEQDIVNKRIEQEAECQVLLNAVSKLSSRERNIMELRFGLSGNQEHTQKEVADFLGISQSYISRLEKRIIERLKRDLERVC